jgi:hypothetical protein
VTKTDPSGENPGACALTTWNPFLLAACLGVSLAGDIAAAVVVGAGTGLLLANATSKGSTIKANKKKGGKWEDLNVEKLRKKGFYVRVQVFFWTPWGARFLDACAWQNKQHYSLAPHHPLFCAEYKSSMRADDLYYNSEQYGKDEWIQFRYGFPILLVSVPWY